MNIYRSLIASPWVPWRVRSRIENWTENYCANMWPMAYNFLLFGRARQILRPVTHGPKHHFFGYYDKSPWNASGRFLLAHEVGFNDRPPTPEDAAVIGIIDQHYDNQFIPLSETLAWNWQQGSMLQWHPIDPERLFIHNDCRDAQFVGIVRDTDGTEHRAYNHPIYAITPDGKLGLSLNFARLATHRPGYGYAGALDQFAGQLHSSEDGIILIDMESGNTSLIITLDELAHLNADKSMRNVYHWVNHIQLNPSGTKFAFFHIWRSGDTGWRVRLYTASLDGSGLELFLDADMISHYDWKNDQQIMVWARDSVIGNHFLLCDASDKSRTVVGCDVLTEDGHCSFSPDRQWVLNDTYPDRFDKRTLMLYRWSDGKRTDLARLYSPKSKWWGEIRCDLHPRWSRDGRKVCIDSVHSGSRQIYVADVEELIS